MRFGRLGIAAAVIWAVLYDSRRRQDLDFYTPQRYYYFL